MAAHSLVERLASDIAELPYGETSVARLPSYLLTERLVRFRIRELRIAGPGARFQFEIVSIIPGPRESEGGEPLFLSAEHEV